MISKNNKNINKTTLGPQNKYLEYQKKDYKNDKNINKTTLGPQNQYLEYQKTRTLIKPL